MTTTHNTPSPAAPEVAEAVALLVNFIEDAVVRCAKLWEGFAVAETCPTFSRGDVRYFADTFRAAADTITAQAAHITDLNAKLEAAFEMVREEQLLRVKHHQRADEAEDALEAANAALRVVAEYAFQDEADELSAACEFFPGHADAIAAAQEAPHA